MKLLLSEILDKVKKAKTKEEKRAILKQHETPCLRGLMRINFDDSVKMDLPEGTPPFKRETQKPIGHTHTILEYEYRKFYIWLDPKQRISATKKENAFIQTLEALHYTEADLLCLIKDKNLRHKFPSITDDLIRDVFEGCLPPKTKKEKAPKADTFQMEATEGSSEMVGESSEVEQPVKRGRGRPKTKT